MVYECKGYQPESKVPHSEVEQWLTERVPTIYAAHRQQQQFVNAAIGFEFWTCGSFDEESVKLLTEAKKHTRKYMIDWKTGAEVRTYVQGLSAPGLKKILDEHYFNHPIAVFARNAARSKPAAASTQREPSPFSYAEHL
jgi:hypothetical protein